MEWFNNLNPRLQAAIVAATVSFILAIITITFKDFVIPAFFEKRKNKAKRKNTFKNYAVPLLNSANAMNWRFVEIFNNRASYLLSNSPKNRFNLYKFNSTVYRLCSFMGWLYASKKEISYLEVDRQKHYSNIETAIFEFEKALADGNHYEVIALEKICKIYDIGIAKMSQSEKTKLAIDVENFIFKHRAKNENKLPIDFIPEDQLRLIKEIMDKISQSTNKRVLTDDIITENRAKTIRELSRIEFWIYRDYQSVIGEVMLKEINGASRRYDVISYKDFELLLKEKNTYILQVVELFTNLNINIDDRFDARVQQLKNTFKASIKIIEAYLSVKLDNKIISEKNVNTFKETIKIK